MTLKIDKSYNYINGVKQKKSFPPPDVIERIAATLGIRPYLLFMENGCLESAIQFNADVSIETMQDDSDSRPQVVPRFTPSRNGRQKKDLCRGGKAGITVAEKE